MEENFGACIFVMFRCHEPSVLKRLQIPPRSSRGKLSLPMFFSLPCMCLPARGPVLLRVAVFCNDFLVHITSFGPLSCSSECGEGHWRTCKYSSEEYSSEEAQKRNGSVYASKSKRSLKAFCSSAWCLIVACEAVLWSCLEVRDTSWCASELCLEGAVPNYGHCFVH